MFRKHVLLGIGIVSIIFASVWQTLVLNAAPVTAQSYCSTALAQTAATMSHYNLITLGDLATSSDVEGRTYVGGSLVSGTSANFAIHLNGTPASEETMTIVGNIASGNPIQLQFGSLRLGGDRNGRIINFNGGGSLIADNTLSNTAMSNQLLAASNELATFVANNSVSLPSGQPAPVRFTVDQVNDCGVAIFQINGVDFFKSNLIQHIELNAGSASTILINVAGTSIDWSGNSNLVGLFTDLNWRGRILWNFYEATNINLRSHNLMGALLAPQAAVQTLANIDGATAVGSLNTSSEIHLPNFGGDFSCLCNETPTATPTATATNTPIPPTYTPTATATNTPIPPTYTPTETATNTPIPPTYTPTETATNTPIPPTYTPTETATNSPIPPTYTPTETATNSPLAPTYTPTETATNSPLAPTYTLTETATNTPIPPTYTPTPQSNEYTQGVVTPTATATPTFIEPTAIPTATPMPTATMAPITAALGDRVWLDQTSNGLQDLDEPGVPGIIVTLWSQFGQVIATTTTDGYGYYLFAELPAGDYWLQFTLPTGYHFVVRDQGGNDEFDSDVDPNTGLTEPTSLEGGQVDLRWDVGLVETLGGNEPTNLEETEEPTNFTLQPQLWLPLVSN